MSELAAYFAKIYASGPDPWGYTTRPYEAAKYTATLAALPAARFAHALEIGCSIGVFTARLAERCTHLTAIDLDRTALARAAERCAGLPVSFACMEVPHAWPAGRFDLIVLSEVLYYLAPSDVAETAASAVASLTAEGLVLLVNWLGRPERADEACARFIGASGLTPERGERNDSYRLDLLRRPGPRIGPVSLLERIA